jgi:hypothetical protein|tara:strand:- start:1478 stop:1663 length:186 start_codon:yes stop_codon:yes gene_type:complete
MKHVIKYKIKGYTLIVTLRKGFKKKSATITMENAPRTIDDVPLFLRLQTVNSLITSLEHGR